MLANSDLHSLMNDCYCHTWNRSHITIKKLLSAHYCTRVTIILVKTIISDAVINYWNVGMSAYSCFDKSLP